MLGHAYNKTTKHPSELFTTSSNKLNIDKINTHRKPQNYLNSYAEVIIKQKFCSNSHTCRIRPAYEKI